MSEKRLKLHLDDPRRGSSSGKFPCAGHVPLFSFFLSPSICLSFSPSLRLHKVSCLLLRRKDLALRGCLSLSVSLSRETFKRLETKQQLAYDSSRWLFEMFIHVAHASRSASTQDESTHASASVSARSCELIRETRDCFPSCSRGSDEHSDILQPVRSDDAAYVVRLPPSTFYYVRLTARRILSATSAKNSRCLLKKTSGGEDGSDREPLVIFFVGDGEK